MYSAKISSSMAINRKTGEVKINEASVNVDGYTNKSFTEKSKEEYNSGKELTKPSYLGSSEWPEKTCYDLHWKMFMNFLKWKKKKI